MNPRNPRALPSYATCSLPRVVHVALQKMRRTIRHLATPRLQPTATPPLHPTKSAPTLLLSLIASLAITSADIPQPAAASAPPLVSAANSAAPTKAPAAPAAPAAPTPPPKPPYSDFLDTIVDADDLNEYLVFPLSNGLSSTQ